MPIRLGLSEAHGHSPTRGVDVGAKAGIHDLAADGATARGRAAPRIIVAHAVCSMLAVVTGLFLASRLGSGIAPVGPDGG